MRERSLMNDKNDDAAFRHTRHRQMGMCVSSEFYQPCPMFFTREGASLDLIGHYRGGSAFMICNGPSFAKLDHSLLRQPGIITYGINNGPKTFRPTFWSCVDDPARFLKSIWLDPCITKFVPMTFFEKKFFDNEKWQMIDMKVGECPNVVGFRRNEKLVPGRFLWEDRISWGCHRDYGGGRSVMLPVLRILFLLGFRKVYLLGCDFNMDETYTYHFDEQRTKGAVNCNMGTYKRLKDEYFPALKPEFDAAGFQVFNCNPDSGLKVFPYKSFEEAIKEATSPLGDVKNERTYGMYSKPEEKHLWTVEPPPEKKKHLSTLNELVAQKPKVEKKNEDSSTLPSPEQKLPPCPSCAGDEEMPVDEEAPEQEADNEA